jgi:ankyrin repeat protein
MKQAQAVMLEKSQKKEENHPKNNENSAVEVSVDENVLFEIESESISKIKDSDNADERLISAAHNGDLENVKKALSDGANINAVSTRHAGQSAIQCASLWGRFEIVQYLVGQGADIYARKDHALKLASRAKNEKIIKFLVDLGADPKSI